MLNVNNNKKRLDENDIIVISCETVSKALFKSR